jgi:AraC-like DNA-binding protein
MIRFQIFSPPAELKEIVGHYFIAPGTDINDLPFATEVYPMNIPALNFLSRPGIYKFNRVDVGMEEGLLVNIVGQMCSTRITEFLRPGIIVTVIFTPWGIHKLCGINMLEITDKSVDPFALVGAKELEDCRSQIFATGSLKVGLAVLNGYLLRWSRLQKSDLRNIDKIATLINSMKGNVNIDWLIGEANMSIKTLERHFCDKIGMPPKLFSRITRFSHAIKMLQGNADTFSILADCGYTDQAHFIKECKNLCGRTPKFYLKETEEVSRFFFSHFVKE